MSLFYIHLFNFFFPIKPAWLVLSDICFYITKTFWGKRRDWSLIAHQ